MSSVAHLLLPTLLRRIASHVSPQSFGSLFLICLPSTLLDRESCAEKILWPDSASSGLRVSRVSEARGTYKRSCRHYKVEEQHLLVLPCFSVNFNPLLGLINIRTLTFNRALIKFSVSLDL